MRIAQVAGCLAWLLVSASAESATALEQARELRRALGGLLATTAPPAADYEAYFEMFPGSLAGFQELFATQKYRVVLEQGLAEGSTALYFEHACKAYEAVGAERYAGKFLKIAAEAGSWGGLPNRDDDALLMAGHLFQRLVFRADCAEPAEAELHGAIVTVAARFDDTQLENLYLSLGWDGLEGSGMEWFPSRWLLPKVCERNPSRCPSTRLLTEKHRYLIEE